MRPAYLTTHVEFDDFLFAPVGEQVNGMPLSVLSALAFLDFDPRAKAAQLQGLTTADANKALAALIGRLPVGRWEPSEAGSIAARLVALLPRRPATPVAAPTATGTGGGRLPLASVPPRVWIVGLVLLIALLVGTMANGGLHRAGDPSPSAIPAPIQGEHAGSPIEAPIAN